MLKVWVSTFGGCFFEGVAFGFLAFESASLGLVFCKMFGLALSGVWVIKVQKLQA